MKHKFTLRKDWNINTEFSGIKNKILIFQKGHEFFPNENSEYIVEWIGGKMVFDFDQMLENRDDDDGDLIFDLIKEESLNTKVSEISDTEYDEVKKWRIQLDVETSFKKMKEIEKFINENVSKLL